VYVLRASEPEPKNSSVPKRRWVLRSSETSVRLGQVSVLAILEVPVSFFCFWYLAASTTYPLLTIVGVLCVPMLLLRSSASIDEGVKKLDQYWNRKATDRSFFEVLIGVLISAALSVVVIEVLSRLGTEMGHGNAISFCFVFVCIVSVSAVLASSSVWENQDVGVGLGIGSGMGLPLLIGAFIGIVTFALAASSFDLLLILAFCWAMGLFLFRLVFFPVVALTMFAILIVSPLMLFGVAVRTTCIRIVATLILMRVQLETINPRPSSEAA
jgi:hypothetical protein